MSSDVNKQTIVNFIVELPREVLLCEPDCFAFVQKFWPEANSLFDLASEDRMTEYHKVLCNGPWSENDLADYYAELIQAQEMMQ